MRKQAEDATMQAIAERDYVLRFLEQFGAALLRSRGMALEAATDGVEVRLTYASRADGEAAAACLRDLSRMVSLAGNPMGDAAPASFLQ